MKHKNWNDCISASSELASIDNFSKKEENIHVHALM